MANKTVLVTGASRGIGRSIALQCAKEGMDVIINYSGSLSSAQQVCQECQQLGSKAMIIQCNVSDSDAVKAMIDTIIKEYGRLDALVNNAGISKDSLLIRTQVEDFEKIFEINAKGCFNCMRHAAYLMMKQKSGRIVNMASVIGLIGNVGQISYSASKGAVISMTKTAARELASRGICVNAVAPGYIETEMTSSLNEEIRSKILSMIPMQSLGQVEDVANLVSFLLSENSRYITGQVIQVDGGMVM